MSKILVTGAAGFIGSHLSKRLEKLGHELILVDDFSRGKQQYLDYLGVKTLCKNINLIDYHHDLFNDVDIVFHTACAIGGEQFLHSSQYRETSTLLNNLAIDANVFKGCLKPSVKTIIYTSSVSVYNTSKQYTANANFKENELETQPLEPEGGYGWAKYVGEKQLQYLAKLSKKVGIARIFKSYGPCDDYSEESGQVVCSLMRKAIKYPKEHFIVWGDGTKQRCLVYIDDLIDALIKLSDYPKSLAVNIGGNTPVSINELAIKIAHISGKSMPIIYDKTKGMNGPTSRVPILDIAKEELDWEPKTSLDIGLKKTWDWMKEELSHCH
jgi:nucleoside-diphosphate-sugar epimerase